MSHTIFHLASWILPWYNVQGQIWIQNVQKYVMVMVSLCREQANRFKYRKIIIFWSATICLWTTVSVCEWHEKKLWYINLNSRKIGVLHRKPTLSPWNADIPNNISMWTIQNMILQHTFVRVWLLAFIILEDNNVFLCLFSFSALQSDECHGLLLSQPEASWTTTLPDFAASTCCSSRDSDRGQAGQPSPVQADLVLSASHNSPVQLRSSSVHDWGGVFESQTKAGST